MNEQLWSREAQEAVRATIDGASIDLGDVANVLESLRRLASDTATRIPMDAEKARYGADELPPSDALWLIAYALDHAARELRQVAEELDTAANYRSEKSPEASGSDAADAYPRWRQAALDLQASNGWTDEETAEALGLTLEQFEKGNGTWGETALRVTSSERHVSSDYLLGLSDKERPTGEASHGEGF